MLPLDSDIRSLDCQLRLFCTAFCRYRSLIGMGNRSHLKPHHVAYQLVGVLGVNIFAHLTAGGGSTLRSAGTAPS